MDSGWYEYGGVPTGTEPDPYIPEGQALVTQPGAKESYYQDIASGDIIGGAGFLSDPTEPAMSMQQAAGVQVSQAGIGIGSLVPFLLNMMKGAVGTSLGSTLMSLIGGAGLGAGISGLLGIGGGTNVATIPGTDIALGGPGAAEPSAGIIVKEWAGIGGSRFYLLVNGKVVVRKRNGVWRLIRRPKMLHMKVSNPRMGDVVRADRIVARTAKILRKRLK